MLLSSLLEAGAQPISCGLRAMHAAHGRSAAAPVLKALCALAPDACCCVDALGCRRAQGFNVRQHVRSSCRHHISRRRIHGADAQLKLHTRE